MGLCCEGVEQSIALLMESKPEPHFPHSWLLPHSSVQFIKLGSNQASGRLFGYTHIVMKMTP
jgi:hypothetical protein